MSTPLISVIVPVYNVEKYIVRCVNSILAQTYTNLEVILVDDGSTDSSGKMCDKYAAKDARVRTVHKENGGQSDARNVGMREANGEYFAFVDSDDYIAEDYLIYLYDMLHRNQAQIAICGYKKVHANDKNLDDNTGGVSESIIIYNSYEGMFHLLYQRGMIASVWGRLFHRELFSEICFPKGKLHEDVAVVYKLFDVADKIVYGNDKKYYYFQRKDSTMNKKFNKQRMDYIFFTNECIQYMAENHPELRKAAVSRHFSACFDLLTSIGNDKAENAEEYRKLVGEIKKYRKAVLCDANARWKNRLAAIGSYISVAIVAKLSCLISRP